MERWKDVVGLEGQYQVSDQGRVKNLATGHTTSANKAGRVNLPSRNSKSGRSPHSVKKLMVEAFPELGDPRPGEVWKDIPGYPGYQASSEGRTRYSGRGMRHRPGKLRVYSHGRVRSGVRGLSVMSRAVALAFYGEPPEPWYEVHHLDGDSLNNRPENLRWVSPDDHARLHWEATNKKASGSR